MLIKIDRNEDSVQQFQRMLSFAQQEKILNPILARPSNRHCADCYSSSPTWASLDFGVFVCSNCSGAHRALGPTITRIKSVKLDQWWQVWLDNMYVGNQQINQYWESVPDAANVRRPNANSSPKQYCRFVEEKYVRKKFVADKTMVDPLTAYKNGTFKTVIKVESAPMIVPDPISTITHTLLTSNKNSQSFNLLDDNDFIIPQNTKNSQQNNSKQENYSTKSQGQDQDEFDDYVEAAQPDNNFTLQHNHNNTTSNNNLLSFDELLKSSQPQPQNIHSLHQPPLTNIYMHQQPHHAHYNQSRQYSHNPYIGYMGHNNFHQYQPQQSQNPIYTKFTLK